MGAKNISLEKTSVALQELVNALSSCSAILNTKQISAGEKESAYQHKLQTAQEKIDILVQGSKNAIVNINELATKIDKVLN